MNLEELSCGSTSETKTEVQKPPRTSSIVQRKCIMWTIDNIKECIRRQSKMSNILASPLIKEPCLELTLTFNSISNDNGIQILIKQTSLSSNKERLFVKCKKTLVTAHEDFTTVAESSRLFKLDTSDNWSFPSFITTNMLTDENYNFVEDSVAHPKRNSPSHTRIRYITWRTATCRLLSR